MISKKIIYFGNFDDAAVAKMYAITRDTEITGEVRKIAMDQVELTLEGDATFIKLIQHQIERALKSKIKNKEVTPAPYKNFKGIVFLT